MFIFDKKNPSDYFFWCGKKRKNSSFYKNEPKIKLLKNNLMREEEKEFPQAASHMIVIPRLKRLGDFPTNVPFCKVPTTAGNWALSKNNKSLKKMDLRVKQRFFDRLYEKY